MHFSTVPESCELRQAKYDAKAFRSEQSIIETEVDVLSGMIGALCRYLNSASGDRQQAVRLGEVGA